MKALVSILVLSLLILLSPTNSLAQREIDECFKYFNVQNYQKAIEAGLRAVKLYPNNAHSHLCLGRAYLRIGNLDLAISSLRSAERVAVFEIELMVIYNELGLSFHGKGNLDDAFLYYNRALALVKKLGDRDGESSLLNNIGEIFRSKGDLDRALKYYEDSLRLTKEKDKPPTLNNIAIIYGKKGEPERAISYFKQAIEISEKYGDYHRTAQTMLNLGETYRKILDFKKAEEYLKEGLTRILKIGDKYWEALAYAYFGKLYRDKGEIKSAREYFTKAYNLFNSIGAENEAEKVSRDLKLLEDPKRSK